MRSVFYICVIYGGYDYIILFRFLTFRIVFFLYNLVILELNYIIIIDIISFSYPSYRFFFI